MSRLACGDMESNILLLVAVISESGKDRKNGRQVYDRDGRSKRLVEQVS